MKRRRKRRDFWRAWREERRRRWGNEPLRDVSNRPSPPPEVVQAWREYFSGFTGHPMEKHWFFGGRRFKPWHQGMMAFNPFVASLFSHGGGLLPLMVLHLLAEQPLYGNEIMTRIVERTEGQWTSNPGAIYPLMNDLEERGLIEGEWENPRKRTVRIYTITDDGREELSQLKAIMRPKLREAITLLQELANDLNHTDDNTNEGDKYI